MMGAKHYLSREQIGEILTAAKSQQTVDDVPEPDIYIGEIPGWSQATIKMWITQEKA